MDGSLSIEEMSQKNCQGHVLAALEILHTQLVDHAPERFLGLRYPANRAPRNLRGRFELAACCCDRFRSPVT